MKFSKWGHFTLLSYKPVTSLLCYHPSVCPSVSWLSSGCARPQLNQPRLYVCQPEAACLWIRVCVSTHASIVCLPYLAQCTRSPRTLVCVCVDSDVCVCLRHSSCLLASIASSDDWTSQRISASCYLEGSAQTDRQIRISNNASRDRSQNITKKVEPAHLGVCEILSESDQHWMCNQLLLWSRK